MGTVNDAEVGYTPAHPPASGNEFATKYDVNAAATGGTVTSVAQTVPPFLAIAGSPITTSGTLAITGAVLAANLVVASPASGGPAAVAARALVVADIPALPASQITSGLLPVARGGNTPLTLAGDTSESQGSWLLCGSVSLASSNYPTGIVFTAEGFVGATGWTLEVALYNLTDASTLDTRTISTTTTAAYASGTLSPASGTKMYEIRIRRQGSGSLPSFGTLTRAYLSAA